MTDIEEAKNLNIITSEVLLGSFIIHEHSLGRDWKEKEVKKKKKDFPLKTHTW